jgi:hypothetical protein
MSLPKKPISERNAAAAVMDGIFSLVDERWFQVWEPVAHVIADQGKSIPKPEFARFNFSLAILAVNFRATFDLFPQAQAERIFGQMLGLLEQQIGNPQGFTAVKNAVMKYIEAYNNGIIAIRNPLNDVAMLYYFKIGLENTKQTIVDETYYIPEPRIVDLSMRGMMMFMGRWELLLERYELVGEAG